MKKNIVKVCHLTSVHKSSDVRIFQKECVSLANAFDVYLIARGNSRKEANVKVIGVGNDNVGRISRMLITTKKMYKKALEIDADIYHIHDPELLPYAMKLHKKGKKVIFDSHEYTFEQIMIKEYIPLFLRKIIAKIYYNYESKITKRIDAVIFPCSFENKNPFEGRAKNTVYINNVPILSGENKMTDATENSSKITFCYVGGLTESRGVTNLLKAYQSTQKKYSLILAGPLSAEYEKKLRDEGLLNGVDYRGVCTREEVMGIYSESHVGISNLLNVGQYPKIGTFPTKVFEYMSCGLAVIVSDYPFARDILTDEDIGILIDPSKPEELAIAMENIAKDPNKIKDMGNRGRKLVEERYNWAIESEKLFELYEKILYND